MVFWGECRWGASAGRAATAHSLLPVQDCPQWASLERGGRWQPGRCRRCGRVKSRGLDWGRHSGGGGSRCRARRGGRWAWRAVGAVSISRWGPAAARRLICIEGGVAGSAGGLKSRGFDLNAHRSPREPHYEEAGPVAGLRPFQVPFPLVYLYEYHAIRGSAYAYTMPTSNYLSKPIT